MDGVSGVWYNSYMEKRNVKANNFKLQGSTPASGKSAEEAAIKSAIRQHSDSTHRNSDDRMGMVDRKQGLKDAVAPSY